MKLLSNELCIGITGHRIPPKLPAESVAPVTQTVRRVLTGIDAAAPGRMAIISALAEGADQIVAEEGLALGRPLDAVLPFPPDDYRRDFETATTAARFDTLVARARSVDVLEFSRDVETAAYEAAGERMLARTGLLIAIWNEEPASGRGGTGHVVDDARQKGIPVVLINPAMPDRFRVLHPVGPDTVAGGSPEDQLAGVVDRLVQVAKDGR